MPPPDTTASRPPGSTPSPRTDWQHRLMDGFPGPNPPAPAMVSNALLDGVTNRAPERAVADRLRTADPRVRAWARAHGSFPGRALRHLTGTGIRQLLDLGCGVPPGGVAGYLHATRAAPPYTRLVCVDVDPIAVSLLRKELTGTSTKTITGERTIVLHDRQLRFAALVGDLRQPDILLNDPVLNDVIDLGQPVIVVLTGVLHYLTDTEATRLIAVLRDALVDGSALIVSHPALPSPLSPALAAAIEHYQSTTAAMTLRHIDQAPGLLGAGWQLLHPGITAVTEWRPDPDDPPVTGPPPDDAGATGGWACVAVTGPPGQLIRPANEARR